ncbi:MAG: SGNH/GDSL hydrolase family protein [Vicinamibacteria bacterium]
MNSRQREERAFTGEAASTPRRTNSVGLGRLLVRVLGATLVSALVLFAAEGLVRATGRHFPGLRHGDRSQDLWIADPSKGWSHRRGFATELPLGGPDPGRVQTNSLGLRGPEVSARKPRDTKRLLVIGDSFAFGHGVDDEHTVSAHLSERLNAGGHGVWEVVNLGVNSYSTDQELVLFQEIAPRLQPDLTVLFVCDNDFEANTLDFVNQRYYKPYFVLSPPEGRLTEHNVPVPSFTTWQRAKLWLGQRSEVWNAIRSRRSDLPWVNSILRVFQIATPQPATSPEVPLTAALIVAMRDAARAMGSEFVMLNAAQRGEKTELLQAVRPLLRREQVRLLGLEGNLGEARKRNPSGRWDFPNDRHWNVAATDLVARVTFNFLEASALLDNPPRQ